MEQETSVKTGDFIDFGDSGLRHYHRRGDSDNFIGTREVLAVSSIISNSSYSVVYADEKGLCASSYISITNGISFLPKDKVVEPSLASEAVPTYKWGDTDCTAERLLSVINGLGGAGENSIGHWLRGFNDDLFKYMDLESLYTSCRIYHPVLTEGGKLSLFLNQKDFDRNRRTVMKAGRAFRHMFQNMSDAQIARINDKWLDETAPRHFTLRVGRTIEDFNTAYTADRTKSRNLKTTKHDYKSLAMSCMHNQTLETDHEGYRREESPAAVYASGDFEIAYLVEEDENGEVEKVAGRVIYSVGNVDKDGNITDRFNAPVYAACEQSGTMLKEHLAKLGCESSSDLLEWEGLHLLKMEAVYFDSFLAPYFDGDISCDIGCKHLVLSRIGDYSLNNTEGTLHEGSFCVFCDCRVSENEVYYSDDGPLCEDCYSENYGACAVSGEVFHINDLVEVKRLTSSGTSIWDYVHIDYGRYCECVEEWWFEDDVTITQDGEYVPTCRVEDFPELFEEEVPEDLEVA